MSPIAARTNPENGRNRGGTYFLFDCAPDNWRGADGVDADCSASPQLFPVSALATAKNLMPGKVIVKLEDVLPPSMDFDSLHVSDLSLPLKNTNILRTYLLIQNTISI